MRCNQGGKKPVQGVTNPVSQMLNTIPPMLLLCATSAYEHENELPCLGFLCVCEREGLMKGGGSRTVLGFFFLDLHGSRFDLVF